MKRILSILWALALVGCAQTTAVLVDDSKQFPPTTSVQLLGAVPNRPYIQIAVLESTGPVNTPMPQLLKSMKKKGMALGADAVIPIQDASTKQEQALIYNAWLGGYQTIGGGILPVVRGIAIKFTD